MDYFLLSAGLILTLAAALLLIFAVDFLATAVGTKKFGGSRRSAFGATLGTLLGLFLFPPFGIILGPFLGAVAAELLSGKKSIGACHLGRMNPPTRGITVESLSRTPVISDCTPTRSSISRRSTGIPIDSRYCCSLVVTVSAPFVKTMRSELNRRTSKAR